MQITAECSNVKGVPPRLTVSSYAVLGLLAIQPWTGYELTQQATRSLRFAWPKSERLLYAEPKKLVEHGLATAQEESVGQRSRTVYTITDAGRAALAEWLTVPGDSPSTEHEAMLKVFYANFGDTAIGASSPQQASHGKAGKNSRTRWRRRMFRTSSRRSSYPTAVSLCNPPRPATRISAHPHPEASS